MYSPRIPKKSNWIPPKRKIDTIIVGILGEYILSIHGQVRRTPPMFEVERINFRKGS